MGDRWARVADEWAIRDTLSRYWRGVDRRDEALVASTYHPGAYDDHGYYKGAVEGFIKTLSPSVWAYFEKTQHFSGHIAIDFDDTNPDLAYAESYAEAHHLRTADDGSVSDLVYGLRYIDRFTRVNGEWRIAHRVCTWDWSRSDDAGGIPLPDSYYRGDHSSGDLVYEHPLGQGTPASKGELVAKQACMDTLSRYARGIDRCDLATVRETYHSDAYDDHGGYQGDVEGFLRWVKPTVMDTFSVTMHKLGNSLIEVELARDRSDDETIDRAWAETYAVVHHVQETEAGAGATDLVMGVRYIDRLEDRGTGWKIAARRMSFEWERTLSIGSQVPYPGFSVGLRDGSDPVLLANPILSETSRLGTSSIGAEKLEASFEVVADRAEIYAVLVRYCRGVDRRDREMIRSTYHEDAEDDHGTYQGDLEGFLDFVEGEVHARFRTTMHKLGQVLIEVEGDHARSESYAICHHVSEEGGLDVSDSVMGIRYLDTLERRDGAWKIAKRQLLWEWIRQDATIALDPDWTLGIAGSGDSVFAHH